MSKKTRKEKREEERRLLSEFDEAVQKEREERGETLPTVIEEKKRTRESFYSSTQPQELHCRRCKTVMENGKCPVCGYKTYIPMSEDKRKKIRYILAAVCMGIFVILFFLLR